MGVLTTSLPMVWPRHGWRGALLCLLLAAVGMSQAQDEAPLKAAIVFSLLQFVTWPDEAGQPAGTPLRLCVDRQGALWPHLRALQDRPLRQWRLDVRDLPDADGLRQCHAWLADGGPIARRLPVRGVPGASTLVIGDVDRANEAGVVVGLHFAGERIGFDVDLVAAHAAGLQVSSKLLRLARKVRE